MACYFHGSVFCQLLAWQRFSMGALSPRRRRCSSALQKEFRVLATMFFYGLLLWHRGTIRSASKRLFLPTFSGKTEKVGLRSNGCGVAAKEAVSVNSDKRANVGIGPYGRREFWHNRKSRPPEAQLRCCRKGGSPVNSDKRTDRVVSPYVLSRAGKGMNRPRVFGVIRRSDVCRKILSAAAKPRRFSHT